MTLDIESTRRLHEMFAAITAEVERGRDGEIEAMVHCAPGGKVLRWLVKPAWVKSGKAIDAGRVEGVKSE